MKWYLEWAERNPYLSLVFVILCGFFALSVLAMLK